MALPTYIVTQSSPPSDVADADELISTASNKGASLIGINDAGNYYSGGTTESALQQLGPLLAGGLIGYRRPNLEYVGSGYDHSAALDIQIENNTETAHETKIMFKDGSMRTVTENLSSTHQYRGFLTSDTAALSGTHNSGIRPTETLTDERWYSVYAVKTTDDANKFVLVFTNTAPTQANYSTLNGYFGTNGWVYLGTFRYGCIYETDRVFNFTHCGSVMLTKNDYGVELSAGTITSSVDYTMTSGMGNTDIPPHFGQLYYRCYASNPTSGGMGINIYPENPTYALIFLDNAPLDATLNHNFWSAKHGITMFHSGADTFHGQISLIGWTDNVLAVGSNPFL